MAYCNVSVTDVEAAIHSRGDRISYTEMKNAGLSTGWEILISLKSSKDFAFFTSKLHFPMDFIRKCDIWLMPLIFLSPQLRPGQQCIKVLCWKDCISQPYLASLQWEWNHHCIYCNPWLHPAGSLPAFIHGAQSLWHPYDSPPFSYQGPEPPDRLPNMRNSCMGTEDAAAISVIRKGQH